VIPILLLFATTYYPTMEEGPSSSDVLICIVIVGRGYCRHDPRIKAMLSCTTKAKEFFSQRVHTSQHLFFL
jgi:hypothetical protein